jgi:hypothetical protein
VALQAHIAPSLDCAIISPGHIARKSWERWPLNGDRRNGPDNQDSPVHMRDSSDARESSTEPVTVCILQGPIHLKLCLPVCPIEGGAVCPAAVCRRAHTRGVPAPLAVLEIELLDGETGGEMDDIQRNAAGSSCASPPQGLGERPSDIIMMVVTVGTCHCTLS